MKRILALSLFAAASLTAQALFWRHYARDGRRDGVAHAGADGGGLRDDRMAEAERERAGRVLPVTYRTLRPIELTVVRPPIGVAPMRTVLDP